MNSKVDPMIIPFNDLQAQYKSIKFEIDQAIQSAINSYQFVKGHTVSEFEKAFSEKLQCNHCISTANGTDALFISLKALNIGYGDEVLTPAFSWVSSVEIISLSGASPVFVDVDPQTYTIDPLKIEERITPKTKAIIAVHLYGHPAPLKEIKKICEKYSLFLIEDCAQAHLSKENGHYTGTIGDVAAFSFYPTKNLGAFGDAGCILTANDHLAERIRRLTNHGALEKDDHLIEGMNSRMDTIQAAILLAKLSHLDRWNEKRRQNAQHYKNQLNDIPDVILPVEKDNVIHTFHLFVVRAQKRNELKSFLEKRGIQTLIHYPKALTNLPAYRSLKDINFPVADKLESEVLSLPVFAELSTSNITFICENIREFYLK